ncbi:MAG TPA: hypothetical protein VGM49_01690 [Candidatus Limnocylindrales bacterium]|jgi:hypothetical protein
MEFWLFLGGVLVVIAVILIRGRAKGTGSGPYDTKGARPIGEIDLARLSSGRGVQSWPGENAKGAGRGIAGLGGNSPHVDGPDGSVGDS